ncbi:MCM DNA helicase [Haloferax larsenii JCM 13917]|nr:MCM DNA helicase [Haloferax larsenii JCM 13917]
MMSYIPQGDGDFQEPHECQGCERQGPFQFDFDQSNFVDSQKIRVQESPEGLRGGETPQSIDINLVDDITGKVTAGDHVTVTGILHIEQQSSGNQKTPVFDYYMEGVSVTVEDEVEYIDECPSCGMLFLGMTPAEFREKHDRDPLNVLYVFPRGSR